MSAKSYIIGAILGLVIGAGATVAGYTIAQTNFKGEEPSISQPSNSDDFETSVQESGIKLKLLSAETLANGDTVQTFSYTIQPANATNQQINATVQYATGGTATEISAQVNSEAKTITLTCSAAFSKVINVVLTAADGGGATATIKCDYMKKITQFFNGTVASMNNYATSTDFYRANAQYSLYTIDVDYSSASIDITGGSSSNLIEFKSVSENSLSTYTSDLNLITTMLKTSLSNPQVEKAFPKASDVWSTISENFKNAIKALDNEAITFTFTFPKQLQLEYSTDQYTGEALTYANQDISMTYDFGSLNLNISSINPGETAVIF